MADTKLSALSLISAPTTDDYLYLVDDPAGTPASNAIDISRLAGFLFPSMAGGRLTLTSGTAVTTADVTAATNVYYTPYIHDRISVFDGTRWKLYTFTELTLALGTLTSALPYDVFIYDNSGTLTLESLAWTSATARATALTTQNGVSVKSGATTRRYLGTFFTTSTTTTEDSQQNAYLFNEMNQVLRPRAISENTSHAYAVNTLREWNNATALRVNVVLGKAAVLTQSVVARIRCDTVANAAHYIWPAQVDSTTTGFGTAIAYILDNTGARIDSTLSNVTAQAVAVGKHFLTVLEASATGSGTFDRGGNTVLITH